MIEKNLSTQACMQQTHTKKEKTCKKTELFSILYFVELVWVRYPE